MPTYEYKKFFYFWGPVLLYAVFIFILSSFPFAFPLVFKIRFLDSILHMIEYGILGYLLGRAFLKESSPFFQKSFQAWAAALAICYGFTDEIHQFYVPMRQSSALDLWFDGAGAVLAQFLFRR